jgi:hypothetical protein
MALASGHPPFAPYYMKTKAIFQSAYALMQNLELSINGYAKRKDRSPCGYNDPNIAYIDLAAAFWRVTNGDEEKFNLAWHKFRNHVGWDVWDDTHTNRHFCKWLDLKSKEWHLERLIELAEGREMFIARNGNGSVWKNAILEYV